MSRYSRKRYSLFFYITWIMTIMSCVTLGVGIHIESIGMWIASACLIVICGITAICEGCKGD